MLVHEPQRDEPSSPMREGTPLRDGTPMRDGDDSSPFHFADASPAWSAMGATPPHVDHPKVFVSPDPLRFDVATEAGRAGLRGHLDQYGYAIAASCAAPAEVDSLIASLWDWLEGAAGPSSMVQRTQPETWSGPGWLPDPVNGIVSGNGIGQAPCMWNARQLPRVRDAFATIWGTHDLLTSFDGANVFRPWIDRPERRTEGGWYHVDQGIAKQGCHCVQGLLTLTDATYHTGGLVVVPGSHRAHADFCARLAHMQPPGRDFLPIPPGDAVLADGAVLVCARAGDLILWDSRCVHCNAPGCDPSYEMLNRWSDPHAAVAAMAGGNATADSFRAVGYDAPASAPHGFAEAWRSWVGGDGRVDEVDDSAHALDCTDDDGLASDRCAGGEFAETFGERQDGVGVAEEEEADAAEEAMIERPSDAGSVGHESEEEGGTQRGAPDERSAAPHDGSVGDREPCDDAAQARSAGAADGADEEDACIQPGTPMREDEEACCDTHDAQAGAEPGDDDAQSHAKPHDLGRDPPSSERLLRATCYICMTPAEWASPEVLRQRQLGYEYNLTTSHWPHEWLPIGGHVPHLPPNDPRQLSATQRWLIGYDRGVGAEEQ